LRGRNHQDGLADGRLRRRALLPLGAGSPLLVLSIRPVHTARPCISGRLPAGRGSAEQDAVHLQRGDRAALGAPDGRPDCTNILRFNVQERLRRSAKLCPESGDLPAGRWNGTMRTSLIPRLYPSKTEMAAASGTVGCPSSTSGCSRSTPPSARLSVSK